MQSNNEESRSKLEESETTTLRCESPLFEPSVTISNIFNVTVSSLCVSCLFSALYDRQMFISRINNLQTSRTLTVQAGFT